MIDYVALDISYLERELLTKNSLLNFTKEAKINPESGEFEIIETVEGRVKPELTAKHKNLVFEIYRNGNIYIKGSVHVYFNDGIHNHNDFTIDNLIWVFNDLNQKFGIKAELTKIRHLEFGLNIESLPYNSPTIIRNLMFEGGKGKGPLPFKYYLQRTKSEFVSTEERDNYRLKIYDKGQHYKKNYEIFRFECKTQKGSSLISIGIKCLNDLIIKDKVRSLGERLISLWDEVVISDCSIRKNELSQKQLIKLKDWKNSKYWIELHNKTREKGRNKFSRELTNYRKVVQDHSDNVHKIIKEAIIEKWCKITKKLDPVQNIDMVQDHPIILYDPAPNQPTKKILSESRFCKITGVDITSQKEGSKFVRESILRAMKEDYDPLMYEYLKSKFGPVRKQPKDFKEELVIIAKNIRNKDSNPRANMEGKNQRKIRILKNFKNFYKLSLFPFQESVNEVSN